MNENKIEKIAKQIYDLTEESTYNIVNKLSSIQNIDQTMIYVFIRALYMHCIQKYFAIKNNQGDFERIYFEYKKILRQYYISNNYNISDELLEDVIQIFDKSYEFLETLRFKNIYDSYDFRHHIIDCMELLRKILESKSKSNIRVDIFDNSISEIKNKAEEIIDLVGKEG